jgi:hypothetical protein
MDMEVAARVLGGSILTVLSFVVVVIGIVAINNIISKFWKPVRIFTSDSWNFNPPMRYATDEELNRIAPELGETKTIVDTNISTK